MADGWLKTPSIIDAFKNIKRADFLTEDSRDLAEENTALAIGHGQTISQPLVVAFMLELLSPQPGEKILDVGSGSGWTTALLAQIVSQRGSSNEQFPIPENQGKVIAMEIVPGLCGFGMENVGKYNFLERRIVEFVFGDGSNGYEKEAPFDKILASASSEEKIPEAWKKQLKVGGKIVAPVGNSIWQITKKGENEFEEIEHPGFVFVPLISKQ